MTPSGVIPIIGERKDLTDYITAVDVNMSIDPEIIDGIVESGGYEGDVGFHWIAYSASFSYQVLFTNSNDAMMFKLSLRTK